MNPYEIKTVSESIAPNPYPGRGIILGTTPDGQKGIVAYFIMGRSENSRNRIFTLKEGELFTEPFDPSRVKDPSLIIYAALRSLGNKLMVTNGDQTDTVYEYISRGESFEAALNTRCFEPDAPNFTPRISGMMCFEGEERGYKISILKSQDPQGKNCVRYTFKYSFEAGLGHFIHTYAWDGNPIPSFQGEPERIQTRDDIDAFTDELWEALNKDNRISLYVRYTDLKDGSYKDKLINKNA